MKCGLLSLALLGATPASGCWLRNSADGTTELPRHWGQHAAIKEALAADGPATTVRAKRISGKRALATACSDNKHFSECSRDRGSAIRLERCLKKRSGNKLSATCQKGLQTWKQLLAETAPNARNRKGNGPGRKKAAKKALARSERVPGTKGLVDLGGGWVVDPVEPHHPHHEGLGGHQGHPHPPHHRMGPHHHAHAPPGFFEDDDILLLEKRRPSMFSVLTDWIFGDSSSSDSLDSFAWDASSSTDDDVLLGTVSIGSSSATVVDAGFFPAGYGIPPPSEAWRVVPRDTFQPKRNARKGLRGNSKPNNVFPESSFERPVGFLAPFFGSGGDGPGGSNGALPAGFFDEEEEEYFGEAVVVEELFQEYGEEGAPSYSAGALEGLTRPAGEGEGELDIDLADIDLADLTVALRRDNFMASPHKGAVRDREMEPEWEYGPEWEWESLPKEDFPMFAGGPRVHPKRHHRGDHIRFRNPLPEDFENQRAWLSDSFDADGDGPDLIEAILAFFFFIGAMTLMLLPFFLLGRALKRMVRNGGGDGSDAEAPDGYYALPEDDSAAAAAGMVSADDDDDSIVVTGTPVNPPPSVHL